MILAKKIPLCALTTLRLCVNKKIRRGGPEILRDKQQRRGDAKKEIPLRLCGSAPSREQKKEALPKTLPCRRRA